jgi:hypothetical protein
VLIAHGVVLIHVQRLAQPRVREWAVVAGVLWDRQAHTPITSLSCHEACSILAHMGRCSA